MDEKKRNIQDACSVIGVLAIFIYFILTVVGSSVILLNLRILFAGIGLIVYAIKMLSEVLNNNPYGDSLFFIAICLVDIVCTTINLVQM